MEVMAIIIEFVTGKRVYVVSNLYGMIITGSPRLLYFLQWFREAIRLL